MQAPSTAVPAGSLAGFTIYVGAANTSWNDPSNFACPQPFADFYTASATVPCQTTGRFVWVVLPPPTQPVTRQLPLCGVQVWQRTPWAWRPITQLIEVAKGKPITSSVGNYGSYVAKYANDGVLANAVSTNTCFHSATLSSSAISPALTIDLGAVYDVSYVTLWPRTDCCASPRNLGWQLQIGNSLNPQYNTLCTQMPQDVTPTPPNPVAGKGPAYKNYNKTVPCAARGRYVTVSRPYRTADGAANNYLQLCEIQVWANPIVNLPVPRAGHAATSFRGQMVVAGGYDSDGNALADIALFDYRSLVWTAIGSTTGSAPAVRYYAAALPATLNTLAYFGGFGGAALSDMNVLTFPSCPSLGGPFSTLGASLACTSGGSSCAVTCAPGYSVTDSALLTCGPAGLYYSATPPCTGTLLSAPGPAAPTVTALDSTSVRATWSAIPAGPSTSAAQYINYLVQASLLAAAAAPFLRALMPTAPNPRADVRPSLRP